MDRILREMAEALELAPQTYHGQPGEESQRDRPEGAWTVTLSVTLAKQWAGLLRALADVAEAHGSRSWDMRDDLAELTERIARRHAERHENQSDPLGGV